VDLDFFERSSRSPRAHIWVVHDLAYAEIVFDGYKAPSILQVPGAKDIAVEFYTLSKSYNMPGWRVGFMCGNPTLVAALARMKSYLDYGTFTPIQVAAIAALEGPQDCVQEICECTAVPPRRAVRRSERDGLEGGEAEGDDVRLGADPRALPRAGLAGVLQEAAARGQGRGVAGHRFRRVTATTHVRFSLIENEHRTRQALRGIKDDVPRNPRQTNRRHRASPRPPDPLPPTTTIG
jgi:alanine-synthesizing transaminase